MQEGGAIGVVVRQLPTSVMILTLRSVHSQVRREENAMDRTTYTYVYICVYYILEYATIYRRIF